MDDPTYRAAPGVNYSKLKNIKRSPLHVNVVFHPTPAMMKGSIVDEMITDGKMSDHYAVKNWDGRTKEGRAKTAEVKEKGQVVIEQEMFEQCQGMADAVLGHPDAAEMLNHCKKQVPAFATDPTTGLDLKCLFDFISMDGDDNQGDLKTTNVDLSDGDNWAREVYNRSYHIQMAHYLHIKRLIEPGVPADNWYWICVENTEPYGVRMFEAGRDYMQFAHHKYMQLLEKWKVTCDKKQWKAGYPTYIETIDPPKWAS